MEMENERCERWERICRLQLSKGECALQLKCLMCRRSELLTFTFSNMSQSHVEDDGSYVFDGLRVRRTEIKL